MRRIGLILVLFLILIGCSLSDQWNISPTPPSTVTPVISLVAGDLGWGAISGTVINDLSGESVVGATVTCEHTSYTSPARCSGKTTTDENGKFIFENIFFHDTDHLTLRVEASGYEPQTFEFNFFTQPGLDITLRIRASGPTPMIMCTPPACPSSNFLACGNPNGCPGGCGTVCTAPTESTIPFAAGGPLIGKCPVFPADNFWNTPVDKLPVHPQSETWIESIGRDTGFHMDFGSGTWDGGPIGIPFNIFAGSTVTQFQPNFYYPEESDAEPYPIPSKPQIEYGSDHHILSVDTDTCKLYEIYDASFDNGTWSGGSGAIWDLHSNALRPETWTSADAAGLPILPGLARYDEIAAGEIKHALRFTAENTAGYIWPARHQTADAQDGVPPMGARFRLKADYDISGFPPELQIILQAMKTYGIVLADNGSNWYISGAPDERWDNDMLHQLDVLSGNDFEAVDTSVLMLDVNSAGTR